MVKLAGKVFREFSGLSDHFPMRAFFDSFKKSPGICHVYKCRNHILGFHLNRTTEGIYEYPDVSYIMRWFKRHKRRKIAKMLNEYYCTDIARFIANYII